MNRSERRKMQKQGCSNQSIIKQCKDDAYIDGVKQGIAHAHRMLLLIIAYTSRIHFDLDRNQLVEYMNRVLNNIDSFRTGQLESGDLELIADECRQYGFEISKYKLKEDEEFVTRKL